MKRLTKVAKMAGLAFENALRLHSDSILLHSNKSYPTAFQLSVLVQEEIGKSFMLEEIIHMSHDRESGHLEDNEIEDFMGMLKSHQIKQTWFTNVAFPSARFNRPRFARDIWEGKLEQRKQEATYIGLTKEGKKMNAKGKISIPNRKIRMAESKAQITRVNDFLLDFIEGCRQEVYGVDIDEVDGLLTRGLARKLEKAWPHKNPRMAKRLTKLQSL